MGIGMRKVRMKMGTKIELESFFGCCCYWLLLLHSSLIVPSLGPLGGD